MIDTVYVVAMRSEAECAIRNLNIVNLHAIYGRDDFYGRKVTFGTRKCGFGNGRPIAVIECGVGKVNAAAGAQIALSEFGAREIRNFGLAGSFDPRFRVGDIVTASGAVEYDIDLADVNGTEIGTPDECDEPIIPCEPIKGMPRAVVGSTDTFREGRSERDGVVMERLGIAVRDMECAAIAHVCQRAGVPFKAAKCISDTSAGPMMLNQYADNKDKCLTILSDAFARNLI